MVSAAQTRYVIAAVVVMLFLSGAAGRGEDELIRKYTFDPGGCDDYTEDVIREAASPEYFSSVWKKTTGGKGGTMCLQIGTSEWWNLVRSGMNSDTIGATFRIPPEFQSAFLSGAKVRVSLDFKILDPGLGVLEIKCPFQVGGGMQRYFQFGTALMSCNLIHYRETEAGEEIGQSVSLSTWDLSIDSREFVTMVTTGSIPNPDKKQTRTVSPATGGTEWIYTNEVSGGEWCTADYEPPLRPIAKKVFTDGEGHYIRQLRKNECVEVDSLGRPLPYFYTLTGDRIHSNRWYKLVLEGETNSSFITCMVSDGQSLSSTLKRPQPDSLMGLFNSFEVSVHQGALRVDNVEISLLPSAAPQPIEVVPSADYGHECEIFEFFTGGARNASPDEVAGYWIDEEDPRKFLFWEDFRFKPAGVVDEASFAIPYAVKVAHGPDGGVFPPHLAEDPFDLQYEVTRPGIVKGTLQYRWLVNGIQVGEYPYVDDSLTIDDVQNGVFPVITGPDPNSFPPRVADLFQQPGLFQVELQFKCLWVEGQGQGKFVFTTLDYDTNDSVQVAPLTISVLDRTAPWIIACGNVPEDQLIPDGVDPDDGRCSDSGNWQITPGSSVPPSLGVFVDESGAGTGWLNDSLARRVVPAILPLDDDEMREALEVEDPDSIDDPVQRERIQNLLRLLPWTAQNWKVSAVVGDNTSESGYLAWRYREADEDGNPLGEWSVLDEETGSTWLYQHDEVPLASQEVSAPVAPFGLQALFIQRLQPAVALENIWNGLISNFGGGAEDEPEEESGETPVVGGFQDLADLEIPIDERWQALEYQLRISDKRGEEAIVASTNLSSLDPDWKAVGNWVQTPPVFIKALNNDPPGIAALEISEEQSEMPVFRYPIKSELVRFEEIGLTRRDELGIQSRRLVSGWKTLRSVHETINGEGCYGDSFESEFAHVVAEDEYGEFVPDIDTWNLDDDEAFSIFNIDCRQYRFPTGFFASPAAAADPPGSPASVQEILTLWRESSVSPDNAQWNRVQESAGRLMDDMVDYENSGGMSRRGYSFLMAVPVQIIARGKYMVTVKIVPEDSVESSVRVFYHPPVSCEEPYYQLDTCREIGRGNGTSPLHIVWYRSPSEVYTSDGVKRDPVNFDSEGILRRDMLPGLLVVESFDTGTEDDPADPEVYRRLLFPVYVRARPVVHERVGVQKRQILESDDDSSQTGSSTSGDDRFKWNW